MPTLHAARPLRRRLYHRASCGEARHMVRECSLPCPPRPDSPVDGDEPARKRVNDEAPIHLHEGHVGGLGSTGAAATLRRRLVKLAAAGVGPPGR
jgi:hypothetical protein